MSVSDSQRDLISVQVFYEMMIFKGKTMISRMDGRRLRTCWPGERLPWRRLGGSSDQDERGGEQEALGGTCVQVPLNIDHHFQTQFQGQVVWEISTLLLFSLLLSLGLIVALVVVSNKTPAGHGVKSQMIITLEGNSTTRSKHLCKSPQVTSSSSSSPDVCMTEGCVGKQLDFHLF